MIILGDLYNKSLSDSIGRELSCDVSYPEITVFADTEQRVRLDSDKIKGEKVGVVLSLSENADSSVLRFAFTIDAIVRSGADHITGIIPYIPYSRADHEFRPGEASPLSLVIKLLEDSGVNEFIILDPHSIKIPELFSKKVHALAATDLFGEKIRQLSKEVTLVSPDMGGVRRIEALIDYLDGNVNKLIINKERDYESGSLSISETKGKIAGDCFIIDDIISTGGTILKAVEYLTNNGAKNIYVFATHGIFAGDALAKLAATKISKIYVTDSVPVKATNPKLEVLSAASLLAERIKIDD
ncbi:MAG TPA: ribose-phosphate diphosphokinase [Patescibacteria group bacterium]|nr:ribose-phosphate diphosphokinase [Patescibacteria group bacterium]